MAVDASTDEAIAEWRPILFAFGIELLAFLGPLGMMAAFASGQEGESLKFSFQKSDEKPPLAGIPAKAETGFTVSELIQTLKGVIRTLKGGNP